jgi:lipoic acid synthetase
VNRDDLPDQGAGHFAETIRRTQLANPSLLIEVLIPDFQSQPRLLDTIVAARPAVIAHNLETVERLQHPVRDPRAGFAQSLAVLDTVKRRARELGTGIRTKSSLMLGLGETEQEVLEAMRALRAVDVDFLTLGQYLQPERRKLKVRRFVPPQEFARLERAGLALGFDYVAAGPLVRSSYRAAEFYITRRLRGETAAPAAS